MSYKGDQFLLDHAQVSMIEDQEDEAPDFISVSEYAAINGVHKHTVLNWIRAGKIECRPRLHGKYTRYYILSSEKPPMFRPDKSILS